MRLLHIFVGMYLEAPCFYLSYNRCFKETVQKFQAIEKQKLEI